MCFVVTYWERADLLALVCDVHCEFHVPIGILGQVWYLIVSIPDLCTLTFTDVHLNLEILTCFVRFDSLRPSQQCFSYVETVLPELTSTNLRKLCLAQGHSTVPLEGLKPATPRHRVKHSTSEPLCSQF